jgi:hypothetical protein
MMKEDGTYSYSYVKKNTILDKIKKNKPTLKRGLKYLVAAILVIALILSIVYVYPTIQDTLQDFKNDVQYRQQEHERENLIYNQTKNDIIGTWENKEITITFSETGNMLLKMRFDNFTTLSVKTEYEVKRDGTITFGFTWNELFGDYLTTGYALWGMEYTPSAKMNERYEFIANIEGNTLIMRDIDGFYGEDILIKTSD